MKRRAQPSFAILYITQPEKDLEKLKTAKFFIRVLIICYDFDVSCNKEAVNSCEIYVFVHDLTYVTKSSEIEEGNTGEIRPRGHSDEYVLELRKVFPNDIPTFFNFLGILDKPWGFPFTFIYLSALLKYVGAVLAPIFKH